MLPNLPSPVRVPPGSFSVNLVRRATTSAVIGRSENRQQNYNHYNLKRVSREISVNEWNGNHLWYRKSSANLDVEVTMTRNPGNAQKRLSQILTPATDTIVRRVSCLLDDLHLKTESNESDTSNEGDVETVFEARPRVRPQTIRPFSSYSLSDCYCVEKSEKEIDDYSKSPSPVELIPRVKCEPSFDCFKNQAGTVETDHSILIRQGESEVYSSIYTQDTTSSLSLSALRPSDERPISCEVQSLKTPPSNVSSGKERKYQSFSFPSLGLRSKLSGPSLGLIRKLSGPSLGSHSKVSMEQSYRHKKFKPKGPGQLRKITDKVQIGFKNSCLPRVLSNLKKNVGFFS